ncbi:MAG: hypothetical protein ACI4X9_03465, partial [Kiritimatiellia bacterium]
ILPPTVSKSMVIQRDRPYVLAGRATPGASVSVVFGEFRGNSTADEQGGWQVTIPPIPTSETPGKLEVTGDGTHLVFPEVLIGDVYLVTGYAFGPQTRKGTVKPDELAASLKECGPVRTLTVSTRRASFERPQGLYERGFVKYGGWKPLAGIISHTPYFLIGLGRALGTQRNVPIGLIFADAGAERLEAIIPATAYRTVGLTDLADQAERSIPGTSLGDAAIVAHLAAVRKWAEESAQALDSGRVPTSKCPEFKELKHTDFGTAWNGTIAPLKNLAVKGVIVSVSSAESRTPQNTRKLKEQAFIATARAVWGDAVEVRFIPPQLEPDGAGQINRGERAADTIKR